MLTCLSVRLSKQASESVWQREGERSDTGSCAGGKLGCGSSGTGGAEPSAAGQWTKGQLETQTASTSSADYVSAEHTESAELVR